MTQLYVLLVLLVLLPSGFNASINVTSSGGWTMNTMNCKCYKLFSAKKTWNEAKTACEKERAKLAELKDFNANDFVRTKFGVKAWIGCYRFGEDTRYLNNDYVPYTPYAPHEPDMKSDQQSTNGTEKENDFAILIRPDGKWADEPKNIKYSYICERKGTCKGIVKCVNLPCAAHPNDPCANVQGSYKCDCDEGFIVNGTGCIERSCASLYKSGERKSGIYSIDPDCLEAFKVWCDMKTDGGGWTVFQRRIDASVDFYRGWSNYSSGFGDLKGNFWLGLDKIHRLTKYTKNVLRVDLMDFNNKTAFAKYGTFSVASESESYKLDVGNYSDSGNAGDSLNRHNGMNFTTKDNDNDQDSRNCAMKHKGAWWYNDCMDSNLNGVYQKEDEKDQVGISWYHWRKSDLHSMKKAEMKLRPAEY